MKPVFEADRDKRVPPETMGSAGGQATSMKGSRLGQNPRFGNDACTRWSLWEGPSEAMSLRDAYRFVV